MMADLRAQAERLGTDIRYGMVTEADLSERPFKVTIDDEKVLEAETLIIATGATARYLGLSRRVSTEEWVFLPVPLVTDSSIVER